MSQPIHVTEAEYELMAALWRCGPLSPPDLLAAVQARRDWSGSTIKTLLSRLMHRKAIVAERDRGRLRYRPLLDRQTYVDGEVQALVDRLFDGDPAKLAARLSVRGDD